MALKAYIIKGKKSKINYPSLPWKKGEKEEESKAKVGKRKEIREKRRNQHRSQRRTFVTTESRRNSVL